MRVRKTSSSVSTRNIPSKDATTESAGIYNRRITILAPPATVADGQGGSTGTAWATVISTWAHISTWKGTERFIAQQMYPNKLIRVFIRYRPGLNINASMRIQYRSQLYNIRNVTVPEEAQTIIEILAEELQARGSL